MFEFRLHNKIVKPIWGEKKGNKRNSLHQIEKYRTLDPDFLTGI